MGLHHSEFKNHMYKSLVERLDHNSLHKPRDSSKMRPPLAMDAGEDSIRRYSENFFTSIAPDSGRKES